MFDKTFKRFLPNIRRRICKLILFKFFDQIRITLAGIASMDPSFKFYEGSFSAEITATSSRKSASRVETVSSDRESLLRIARDNRKTSS